MAIIKLNHSGVHGAVSKPCVYGLSFIGLRRRVSVFASSVSFLLWG